MGIERQSPKSTPRSSRRTIQRRNIFSRLQAEPLPLDLHSGDVARTLGLLVRRQNDWRAVEEVTAVLRTFDPEDPVRYDFALFGAGMDGFLKG